MPSEHATLREAALALDSGHPARAQAALRSLPDRGLSATDQALNRSLRSEIALLSGDNAGACALASAVTSRSQAPETMARATAVRAFTAADAGRHREALDLSLRSTAFAKNASDTALFARVVVRLLSIYLDCYPLEESATTVGNAYAIVHRSGDPTIAAHLQVSHAGLEGRRGNTDAAWFHLEQASELLSYATHPLVAVLHSLTSMIVASLEDDHRATVRHGRAALDTALRVGYQRLVPRIKCNLGLGLLRLGDLAEASALFEDTLRHNLSTATFVGVFDSMAQMALLAGDHEECASRLQQATFALPNDIRSYSWYRLGLLETSLENHLAAGSTSCTETAADALDAARKAGNKNFEAIFSLLQARSLLNRGEHKGALAILSTMAPFAAGTTALTTVGRREATLADAYSRTEALGLARAHAGRARRVLSTIGTMLHRHQIEMSHSRLHSVTPDVSISDSVLPLTFDNVGFLIECSDHPEVLAKEAVAQIARSQAVEAAAFTNGTDFTPTLPLWIYGLNRPEDPPAIEILVGDARDGKCVLSVWLQSGAARNECKVIARVAEAAAAQRNLRRVAAGTSQAPTQHARTSAPPDGVFEAASIRKAIDQVERVAATPLTVLFAGETGTGKEVFARLLHRSSPRRNGPFVPFNCASIPHDMLDAQLFGHTRGSFTGAVADSIGVIRAAAGGTLFLDEVGELPPLAQPKLLRFLEHGEIHPIGATQPITVDVRVVAATNSDLVAMVRDKTFREDLYFRLNGITITVPPLRERRDDIPSLVRLYLGRAAGAMGRPTPVVSAAAMELLLLHPWPGNVRQLVVEMRRLVALLPPGREITADALAEVIGTLPGAPPAPRPLEPAADTGPPLATASPAATLADAVDDLERRMIHDALREAGGNVATTAARLGISRKGLFLKRRRLGID